MLIQTKQQLSIKREITVIFYFLICFIIRNRLIVHLALLNFSFFMSLSFSGACHIFNSHCVIYMQFIHKTMVWCGVLIHIISHHPFVVIIPFESFQYLLSPGVVEHS